ncbi:hypothetical protein NC652_017634 [Populus alba x Populus x berolinensis]|nr:hypothetical protein NC652_017634 [Populus alba x Populus x berolinensis]
MCRKRSDLVQYRACSAPLQDSLVSL